MNEDQETKKRSVSTSYLERIRESKEMDSSELLKDMLLFSKTQDSDISFKDLLTAYAEENKPTRGASADENSELVNKLITIFEMVVPMFGAYVSHRATPKADNSYSVTIQNKHGLESKIKVEFTDDSLEQFTLVAGPWTSEVYTMPVMDAEEVTNDDENNDEYVDSEVLELDLDIEERDSDIF